MSSSRLRQFDRQLKRVAVARLVEIGFSPCPERLFRRDVDHEGTLTMQLVDFQVGAKSFVGRFTVNLGVFNLDLMPEELRSGSDQSAVPDCMSDLTQRLGFFHVAKQSRLAKWLGRPEATAHDYWWPQSDDEVAMAETMHSVTDCLMTKGLRWLDSRSTREAFAWATRERDRRMEWKQQLSGPNAVPHFVATPFPSVRN